MSYSYDALRQRLFTEDGVKMLTRIRDNARRLIKQAGAVKMSNTWDGVSGDSWLMLACVDYLVEQKELREIVRQCKGQDRVFVSTSE